MHNVSENITAPASSHMVVVIFASHDSASCGQASLSVDMLCHNNELLDNDRIC